MKIIHITSNLLNSIFLSGLIIACNNDQVVNPVQTDSATEVNKNAKITSEVLLIKDGDNSLEYVKSGKFAGKPARAENSTHFKEYTYDEINGDLWITSKVHSKATNAMVTEEKYRVSNGRCVESKDLTSKHSFEYKYNASGFLTEIKALFAGIPTTIQYTYKAIGLPGAQKLDKITYIGANGPFKEYRFNYSSKQDKYFLNPDHTHLDKYLKIFGKFGDMLIQDVTTEYLDPDPANQLVSFDTYTYILNGDGYVTSRTREYYPYKYEPNKEVKTDLLTYTNAWQGL